jgi:DNA-binding MarR family transcriptional regulator
MPAKRSERDSLDDSLEIWAREIPDLDPVTEGIIERIQILAFNVNQSMDETLATYELDRRSFQLLGKLRRHGAPYRVSAGRLATDLRLSSGAMTNRLDRMEAAGLIRRLPDPSDRRGTLVEPTDAGHKAWDKTVGAQARREAQFSGMLTEAEKDKLHDLLRRLMHAFPDWKQKKHAAHEADTPEPPKG